MTIEDGRVYVTFGGLAGDCGPYTGSVVGVPVSGAGALISYRVPTRKGGAIWGTAGPVAGPGGTLYVSSGNGAAAGGTFDGSDSVTALTPGLKRTGIFAPVTWGQDNANDLDLGSTQPALLPGGTLLTTGKRGIGYLLRAAHLGGVGGQIASGDVCKAFGAAAVSGTTVYEPCPGGLTAVSTAGGRLARAVAGTGRGFGVPGDRRRRGLGEQHQGRDPLRAESGHRRGAGLGPPGRARCRTSRRCRWRGRWRSSARIMA